MSQVSTVISHAIRISPEEIHDDLTMESVESWDSLAHMELVSGIEKSFGIELTSDEIVEMTRVGEIRRILSGKGVN